MAKLHNYPGEIKPRNIKYHYRPAKPAVIMPASGGLVGDF